MNRRGSVRFGGNTPSEKYNMMGTFGGNDNLDAIFEVHGIPGGSKGASFIGRVQSTSKGNNKKD